MIRFEQVGKRYPGGITALADLTLAIESGEMVILSGHSGAGKSTLLKLIPAIERPTQGVVVVNGQNVSALKRAAVPFLRRNLGMIFQDQKLLYDRSVFSNVLLPLAIAGVPPRDAGRRVRAALDKVGLLEREKAMPVALSGGEQQRLSIARAVVARPSILIADEPTAHLDEPTARDIVAVLHSFNQVGVTVLVATHHESLFAPFMTRRVSLSHGRIAQ
ncbi:MAG: ATP-binding cassette domain-containing protein [Rhodocyclaceae bacterium]|nr:ATP-binding cassette domain-containing protein [Rhodocyclaceae bacterium]MCB1892787.1 ATP-binding cassette domain-containing protein [Rhodocyclaceae bacterium]